MTIHQQYPWLGQSLPDGKLIGEIEWQAFLEELTAEWFTACPWRRGFTARDASRWMVERHCERCRFLAGVPPLFNWYEKESIQPIRD